jgi:hypothetical protein
MNFFFYFSCLISFIRLSVFIGNWFSELYNVANLRS